MHLKRDHPERRDTRVSVRARKAGEETVDPSDHRRAAEPQHKFIQAYLTQSPSLRQRDLQSPGPRLGFTPLVSKRQAQINTEKK